MSIESVNFFQFNLSLIIFKVICLDCYLRDVKQGIVSFTDNPKIIKESHATALVDGMNLLGNPLTNGQLSSFKADYFF